MVSTRGSVVISDQIKLSGVLETIINTYDYIYPHATRFSGENSP